MISITSLAVLFEAHAAISGVFLIAPAATYAAIMVVYFPRGRSPQDFITYLFEGVTIGASTIVLLSLFNTRLFEVISDDKVYLMIVTLMTLSYGLRDISERFSRHTKIADPGHAEKQDTLT